MHSCTDTPICSPEASERWEAALDLSDRRGEDSALIGSVVSACGATCSQLTLQFFA
jgi:hypothetical protein